MKKLLTLAVVAVATVFGASAGDGYIGGNIGFEHNEKKGEAQTNSFTILPELGYNLNDNWAIGTTIGYTYKHLNGQDINNNLFQFNPYARYTYFRSDNNLVQLFVDGGAGIGLGWTEYDNDDSSTAVTWNVGLRPGVAFNFTKNFSVVAHVGFLGYKGANRAAYNAGYDRNGGVYLNGNDLTLGFYYNF